MNDVEFFSKTKTIGIIYLFILTFFYIPTLAYQVGNAILGTIFVLVGLTFILTSLFYIIRSYQTMDIKKLEIGIIASIANFLLEMIDLRLGSPSLEYVVTSGEFISYTIFIIINLTVFFVIFRLEITDKSGDEQVHKSIVTTLIYVVILGISAFMLLIFLLILAFSNL